MVEVQLSLLGLRFRSNLINLNRSRLSLYLGRSHVLHLAALLLRGYLRTKGDLLLILVVEAYRVLLDRSPRIITLLLTLPSPK